MGLDALWNEKVDLYNDLMESMSEKYNDEELINIKNKLVKYEKKAIEWEFNLKNKLAAVS